MLELTKEQMEVIQKAISKKAEESVQEFDKELDIVVSKLSTEGWTLPAELNIYAVKTIANTNKLDDINAFLKWFFTIEDFQKTKDMVNGIKASPIKEGLKNLTDQCWQAFQNKLYAVCATSLLSVIEGILSEFSDDKQDVRMMKVCQKKVDTFPSTGSTIQKHVWISYNNFIRNLYQKSDFSADTGRVSSIKSSLYNSRFAIGVFVWWEMSAIKDLILSFSCATFREDASAAER